MGHKETRFRKCGCRQCYACDGSAIGVDGKTCTKCVEGVRCRFPDEPPGFLFGLFVMRNHNANAYCKIKSNLPEKE